MNPPVAMTIAGSDSGGGAGIQADLKTFAALGVFGTSVLTAVTAQNTAAVLGVQVSTRPSSTSRSRPCCATCRWPPLKTGMLASAATVATVARWAAEGELPDLVVDPVLVASTGRRCSTTRASTAYLRAPPPPRPASSPPTSARRPCSPRRPSTDVARHGAAAAQRLAEYRRRAVVVKGGHLAGGRAPDVVLLEGALHVLDGPRVTSANDHGTGCTLSAAIAAHLARGVGALMPWHRPRSSSATPWRERPPGAWVPGRSA